MPPSQPPPSQPTLKHQQSSQPLHQTPSYRHQQQLAQQQQQQLDDGNDIGGSRSPLSFVRKLQTPFAGTDASTSSRAPLMMEMRPLEEHVGPKADSHAADMGQHRYDIHQRQEAIRRWQQTRNWDQFFQRVYDYYTGKGVYTILLGRVVNLMTAAFVVCFATFLFSCIDHRDIANKATLSDAIVPGCLNTLHPFHQMLLFLFLGLCVWQVASLVMSLGPLREMHSFFTHALGIPDSDMQSIHWKEVVARIVRLHTDSTVSAANSTINSGQNGARKKNTLPQRLNAHDIANRIMRKDNYLVALFNKDLLDLSVPLPSWLLFGLGGKQMLTKVLQWHLNVCLLGFVFGVSEGGKEIAVRKQFLRDVQRSKLITALQRRLFLMGLMHLVFAPFILVMVVVYFFFKHGEELHKNPTQMSARAYSPLARWKFRDFNELPHLFQQRLNASYPHAVKYLNQFPQSKLAIVAKFISFIAGSVALALAFLSVLDDDFLIKFHITPGRSVIWYLGIFSMIWSAARGFVPDPHLVYDPEVLLREVAVHTHYLPEQWLRQGLHSDSVRLQFANLFDYRLVLFVQELVSVMLAPLVLWFSLPGCVPRIVDFFREFTVHVDGVGWVCSFAVFDFCQFNQQRGIIQSGPRQGPVNKMEQSAVTFKRQNPDWEPRDPANAQIMSQLLFEDDVMTKSMLSTASAPEHHTFPSVKPAGQQQGGFLDLAASTSAEHNAAEHSSYVPYDLYRRQQPDIIESPPVAAAPLHTSTNSAAPSYSAYIPPPPVPDDEEVTARKTG